MRFLYPELLWLLALLPLLALLKSRRGPAPALLFSTTANVARSDSVRRSSVGSWGPVFKLLAIALLIAALARPQLGKTTTEIEASGIDIMLGVDVSGSMKAMDFSVDNRPVNRLEAVKAVVGRFIEKRPNDRIGLLAFASGPYLISPLTLDHDWLRRRLDKVEIGMIEDGTAIGSAIGTGVSRLRDEQAKSRLMILLTDGMNTAGKVPPLLAAEAARALDVKIYAIGAGTKGFAPMPVTDPFGRQIMRRARVDIDEITLRRIAEETGGRYYRATDTSSLKQIYEEIDAMETTTRTFTQFERYRELFSYCIVMALGCIGLGLFINRNRIP